MSRCHEVGLCEMCEMWLTDCSSCYFSAGVGGRMLWLAKLGCKWCSSVLHSFASNSHLAPARDCFVTACSSLGRHGTSQISWTGVWPAQSSCQILNSQTAAQRRVSDGREEVGWLQLGLAGSDGALRSQPASGLTKQQQVCNHRQTGRGLQLTEQFSSETYECSLSLFLHVKTG